MGQAASKAKAARAELVSKPKTNRNVLKQKLQTARATGVLALPEHKLKNVPTEVWDLTKLRTIDLSHNRLSELPEEVAALTSLKTLKLSGNKLVTLPDLSALTALTTLVLDGNAIESIPHALPPNLTKLSLADNQLVALPESVTALVNLQELDVSGNQLIELAESVTQLTELVDLCLDRNQLQTLPAALAQCGKLKLLSARANRLKGGASPQAIAEPLLATSSVHILNLEGNPMTKIELEAMDGIDAFLERRTQLKNKEIHGGLNTDTSLCGLD